MTKLPYIVDSEVYPIAWRFNSEDCLLSDQEKQSIVFLDEKQSRRLWNIFIPAKHPMELSEKNFVLHEKTILSFCNVDESANFFASRLSHSGFFWFFWSAVAAAIVPRQVFLKSWDDFSTLRMRILYCLRLIALKQHFHLRTPFSTVI